MATTKKFISVAFLAAFLIVESNFIYSQDSGSGYNFTMLKQVKTTPVKNQQITGTCWSFATTSYIETELLRIGQPEFDLSEMFFVRYAYEDKANLYVRYQGTNNFGQGGQAHDVLNLLRKFGMTTEESYQGKNYGTVEHNHDELEGVLKCQKRIPD